MRFWLIETDLIKTDHSDYGKIRAAVVAAPTAERAWEILSAPTGGTDRFGPHGDLYPRYWYAITQLTARAAEGVIVCDVPEG